MLRRKTAILCLAVAGAGGLLTFAMWPSRPPLEITVTRTEPAQAFDDAGAEMRLVTVVLHRPAHDAWIFVGKDGVKVETKVGDRWLPVQDRLLVGAFQGGETKQELLVVPGGTERCRIRLDYVGASLGWRLGGWLWRQGVKLPPMYWAWVGWPRPEGRHPWWKSATIEFPLEPGSSPAPGRASGPGIPQA